MVNHHVDIQSWAYGTWFSAWGAVVSRLIPLGSHSVLCGRKDLLFESLFGLTLGLYFEHHFLHQPVLSRHDKTILVSNMEKQITTVVFNQSICASLTSKVNVDVIVIFNVGLR
jgi:hypothetical protein